MGALNSVPFCSRTAADDNNNLGKFPGIGQWTLNQTPYYVNYGSLLNYA